MNLEGDRRIGAWSRGAFSYFTDGASAVEALGRSGAIQVGLDMAWSDRAVVGVMAHGDLTDQSSGAGEVESLGFLVGPYGVVRLGRGLTFDALVAAGQGFLTYASMSGSEADYQSKRFFVSARLSGDYAYDAWSFRPSLQAAWCAERSDSFVDGDGSAATGSVSVRVPF